jgi:hypothetical protein
MLSSGYQELQESLGVWAVMANEDQASAQSGRIIDFVLSLPLIMIHRSMRSIKPAFYKLFSFSSIHIGKESSAAEAFLVDHLVDHPRSLLEQWSTGGF